MSSALGVAVKPGVPAVRLSAHVRDEQLAEVFLVPDPLRPRKAVRGARTAGGERTWLQQQKSYAGGRPLPGCATVHVACNGRSFAFQLEQGALAPGRFATASSRLPADTPPSRRPSPPQPRRARAPACSEEPSLQESSLTLAGAPLARGARRRV